VPGNAQWGANHRGRTYLFAGPEEQQRFLKDPDLYAPVLAGGDAVVLAEEGRLVSGSRQHGAWYPAQGPDERVYLFANEESWQKFYRDASRYAGAAAQANRTASLGGR
jgi:YHS domain-containing protein